MSHVSPLFPRNFRKAFPVAVRGEGCWILAADGHRYLDASGQAAVVSIGHGVPSIGEAMARQSAAIAFAHTTQFHCDAAGKLAARLLALAPRNFQNGGRVYFTSGGSEATETAIKLANQFFREIGDPDRYRVVSRRQSYHGSTLGAMTVSGNVARREPYRAMLAEWGHIAPCFCYRCPFEKQFPECALACAEELDSFLTQDAVGPAPHSAQNSAEHSAKTAARRIANNAATDVAAFIFEPIVGATLGAAVPPQGYVQRIAELCARHGILLIADEVMTGMGRTGKPFAVQHWGIEPDLILAGKGLASGYAPLGAVLVSARVAQAFERSSGAFQHGFTYQAHPVATAAGNAVLDFLESRQLFDRVATISKFLRDSLSPLETHPNVGEIRGLGLLLGVEFVKNKSTREPFTKEENIAERIRQAALENELLVYPTQGCVDGHRGDHILLAPPFVISEEECSLLAAHLHSTLSQVFPS